MKRIYILAFVSALFLSGCGRHYEDGVFQLSSGKKFHANHVQNLKLDETTEQNVLSDIGKPLDISGDENNKTYTYCMELKRESKSYWLFFSETQIDTTSYKLVVNFENSVAKSFKYIQANQSLCK